MYENPAFDKNKKGDSLSSSPGQDLHRLYKIVYSVGFVILAPLVFTMVLLIIAGAGALKLVLAGSRVSDYIAPATERFSRFSLVIGPGPLPPTSLFVSVPPR